MQIVLAFLERIGASITKRPLLWLSMVLFIALVGLFLLSMHEEKVTGQQKQVIADQKGAIKSLTVDGAKKDQGNQITNSVTTGSVQKSDNIQQHATITKQQRDQAIQKAYNDFSKSSQSAADLQRKDQAVAQAHIDAIWSNFCTTGTVHQDCVASAAQ